MSLRYLLSANCLELEPNPKTYSTLRLHTCFRTLHIAPFYHNMCLVFTLQNREIHAQKTEPENGRDERSKSFPFFIGLNFHVNNFKAKEIFDNRS